MTEQFQRFAGRRKGRPLHQGRHQALEQVTADFIIPKTVMEKYLIDPTKFFSANPDQLWLEIGFGNGEHLTGQAANNPAIGFIGCEPFINGVSAAAKDIVDKRLENIRIWPDEALEFLAKFPPACLDRIFLLFSDPWPKTRQHKRRVVQENSIALFAKLLRPSGILRIATDHCNLAEWSLLHIAQNALFTWKNFANGEWQTPPVDWIETRYQQKAAQQGRRSFFMDFIRN